MAQPSGAPSADDRGFFGHPRGLATLFFTEMWERFSYYGLRPLLVLFMAAALSEGGFGLSRDQASAIVGLYGFSVYLASLPGGWVADRLLGLQRAIFLGACLITSGHLSIGLSGLAGPGAGKVPFFLGLVLIVLGTGLLKPNISAIVGDLYPEGGARRDAGFSIFYMGINFGAFFGQLITGALGEKVGWHWGFGAAGVGMALGLISFWIFRGRTLLGIGVEPTRHPDPAVQARQARTGTIAVFAGLAVIALVFVLAAAGVITIDAQAIGRQTVNITLAMVTAFFIYVFAAGGINGDEKKRIAVIFVLFLFAIVFWGAFEQAPTSLNLFARDFTDRLYDTSGIPAALRIPGYALGGAAVLALLVALGRAVSRGSEAAPSGKVLVSLAVAALVLPLVGYLAGRPQFEVPATWFQSVNSFFVITLAPVAAWTWVSMARRGRELSSPGKFAIGLALAGVGFAIMIYAANIVVSSGGRTLVSPWWLVASYFFQTCGELCLSPVGLSSMTKLSPRKYVGQMMGIWFTASALGNLIGGLVGGHVDPEKLEQMPQLFTQTTIYLFVAAAVLALMAIPIRRMMVGQKDT